MWSRHEKLISDARDPSSAEFDMGTSGSCKSATLEYLDIWLMILIEQWGQWHRMWHILKRIRGVKKQHATLYYCFTHSYYLHSIYHSLPLFSSKSRPAIDNCHQQQMNTYFRTNPRSSTMLTDDDNVQLTKNSYRLLSLERNKVFEFVYFPNISWMAEVRYTRRWMQLLDIFWTHRIDRWTRINSLQHLHGFSSLF